MKKNRSEFDINTIYVVEIEFHAKRLKNSLGNIVLYVCNCTGIHTFDRLNVSNLIRVRQLFFMRF